jgi:hypothetical protein
MFGAERQFHLTPKAAPGEASDAERPRKRERRPKGGAARINACSKSVFLVAPAGFEPLLGGSGESRPLPIRVIL